MIAPEADPEDDDLSPDTGGSVLELDLPDDRAGARLDKTLAELAADLSRGRIQALLAEGRITRDGERVSDASAKAKAGLYRITVPAPVAAEPQAENIPLSVLYEDTDLIVVEKPAGMAVHPAPGSETGTLVNALLHHCGESLSGIGGVARPGIVHRIDKETSGILVAAKSDAAHQGLSKLFASHDIERLYVALVRGAPQPSRGTIETRLGRSANDRKKMAVLKTGGREAITHYRTQRTFGSQEKPVASRISCQLETGRTHQIRVHMASKGTPCLGDPVYGSGSPGQAVRDAMTAASLRRQALHAAVLGFIHPVTGEALRFESELPEDMAQLEILLAAL